MSYVAESFEPAPEADDVAQFLAWAFVIVFGVWAGWGWLADGVNALSLLLAVVFGLFQIATNLLAVKMRQLWGHGAYLTALGAGGFMVGTGLLTHESLNHAYMVTQARGYANADPFLMSWLLLLVPFLEPLMFWINRILMEPANRRKAINLGGVGVITALWLWLFGTGAGAFGAPANNNAPIVSVHTPTPIARSVSRASMRAEEPARAQAKLLARQGMKAKAIHLQTKVPLSTCKLYCQQARDLLAA